MRTVLLGEDHPDMGAVVIKDVGDRVALGMTRGFLPKPYFAVDPNEDAVAAVIGPKATLLVVADGHNGFEATGIAIQCVLDAFGDDPPAADVADADLVGLFYDTGREILAVTRELEAPNRESRTTLTVALLAEHRLQWAAIGDSALLLSTKVSGTELTVPRHRFLGHPSTRSYFENRLQRGIVELAEGAWIALVSDGFTNFSTAPTPADALCTAVRSAADAHHIAEWLIDHAGQGGAGDNVAVAVAAC